MLAACWGRWRRGRSESRTFLRSSGGSSPSPSPKRPCPRSRISTRRSSPSGRGCRSSSRRVTRTHGSNRPSSLCWPRTIRTFRSSRSTIDHRTTPARSSTCSPHSTTVCRSCTTPRCLKGGSARSTRSAWDTNSRTERTCCSPTPTCTSNRGRYSESSRGPRRTRSIISRRFRRPGEPTCSPKRRGRSGTS